MSTSALLARSSLGPRGLDGGSIAGAVVGSVVGALLIALCVVPFALRARRLSRDRRGDAALDAELGQGQSPGGRRSSSPHLDESKRPSGDLVVPGYSSGSPPGLPNGQHPKPANGHSPHLPSLTPLGDVANLHQGLPSPASPPSPKAQDYGQAYPTPPADEPAPPRTHHASIGTVGRDRESTRQLSLTDSYNPPSREITGITSQGITEEPETFEHTSSSPSHRHFPHILGSIRRLTGKRDSDHQRRDSRRSTTDGARSPSVSTTEALSQQEPIQPAFEEVDINARGEAWSYFHDPDLVSEPQVYAPVTTAPAPLTLVPPTHAAAPAPLSPVSLPDQAVPGGAVPPLITRAVVEEPDVISPDSDQTVTPLRAFSRQTTLLRRGESLTRKDSLPPLQPIVADIEGSLLPFTASPSGRPMDMMRPTNEAESAWRVNQDLLKIESPPPPADLVLAYMDPIGETSYIKSNPSPESDYQSPPGIVLNDHDFSEVDFSNMIVDVDAVEEHMAHYSYFTPPPSSGPSNQNTPDTRISDYTASPSPRSDVGHGSTGQMDSSPRLFPCDQCHRVFDQVHKLNHHKRYHDRPHECVHPGCTMRFGTKTHLDRHVNDKHNKTRKFYCTQHDCPYSRQGGKSFPRKDNWRRHMMNKHRITPDTDPIEYNDDMMLVT